MGCAYYCQLILYSLPTHSVNVQLFVHMISALSCDNDRFAITCTCFYPIIEIYMLFVSSQSSIVHLCINVMH